MKKQLLLLVMILLPMVASADPVEIDGIYYNLISKTKTAEVTSNPNNYTGTIIIPEFVTYENTNYTVIRIGESAFWCCSKLISVSIPNSVTSIEKCAFSGCEKLTSVIIPQNVLSIGSEVFSLCTGLTSVTISNSVKRIGLNAFFCCLSLIMVNISDVEAWCNIEFENFNANPLNNAHHLYLNGEEIENLVIPNGVKRIENSAFYGCSGLKTVTIPRNVTTIGNYAFEKCLGLNTVTIGDNVTSIGEFAFEGCSSLTTVTIGNGITLIGYQTFASCPNMTNVYCYTIKVPGTYSEAFKNSYIDFSTLHVPAESVDAYKAAEPWKDFKEIVALTDSDPKPDATRVDVVWKTEDNKAIIYDLNGVRLNEPKKGINIVNGKKYMIK